MKARIAMISEHASPLEAAGGVDSGGQNIYVGQLSKHLAALGYEVDVFTRKDRPDLQRVVRWQEGIRVIHVPAGPARKLRKEDLLPYMEQFTEFLRRFISLDGHSYDLAHANFWMSGLVAAEIKQEFGIPFVVTFHALGRVRRLHQGEADEFPDERFQIEERVMREADRIIAECPQDREDMIKLYGARPEKIVVVPCGFDPEEFEPLAKAQARRLLGIPQKERVVLQIGRMVRRKGVDNVVRGLAVLRHWHGLEASLIIVGGESEEPDPRKTPEIGRLQAIAEDEGVADLVTFAGRRCREVLKYYYNAADVFVTTPWYEPFGITPVEAMACGLPVIGAAVGGIKFSVLDGETGFLVPPDQPEALAERLAYVFENPQILAQYRDAAIARANEHFTWRRVANEMAAVYEEAIMLAQPKEFGREPWDDLETIELGFRGAREALESSQKLLSRQLLAAATAISNCFASGGKLLICGNGGSAADAQHFAAELVGRFKRQGRRGLPALALCSDSAILTAWSNDAGYEDVFARQIQALAGQHDVLMGISTSGRSANVKRAFEAAQEAGIRSIALTGGNGGDLIRLADISIVVPSGDTQHVQEVHIVLIHLLSEIVENRLEGPPLKTTVANGQRVMRPLPRAERNGGKVSRVRA
ncbi:MAG TPA: glycosyltransferase [Dehalococcoidia bacterium]|nr:glycosyltransferase [Dehalococcoidia bacterium]